MGSWWNRYWNGNLFALVSEETGYGICTGWGGDCLYS